ncbi:MAG: Glycosyltransferase involved in cell wall bisynthesis [Candidatus Electronema aureum]|uniref:Glycosyltransferase involved in cell wall bisynthesis n=1 Tax=Candidatus Electronema aureum TaxID=2005002 RepID=A0A521G088_9BACT|nr:MAG: Glycosyltransferase involved in cell wall bisynthesis [Candidatus Electronema aureum]
MEEVLNMPVRILLLTQWFDPEPTFKGMVFARELVRQGFEVEVLTGFPNYPGGKIYPGYRIKLLQRELIDGIRITRVPLYPNHSHSVVKRVLNYLSFAVSSLIYGLFMARRVDVIYAYHPPLTIGITAGLIRFFRRIPVLYDIQDMWPDTLAATGMINNKKLLKIIGVICEWVYKNVDQLVVLSPGFKELLMQRGVPENKIHVIYNWADEVALAGSQSRVSPIFPAQKYFRIVFAGNIGPAQALDAVLDAATILKSRCSRICFVIIGNGLEAARLKERSLKEKLENVIFLSPVSMLEIGSYLKKADALLVHLRNDPLFEITIPSKTQAYMSIGRPLLMAVNGDAANLVRLSGGGLTAQPEHPESIADVAECLANMPTSELHEMGRQAKRYYDQKLSVQAGVVHFCDIFNRLFINRI